MLKCSEATELASAYLDGDLPRWTRLRVRLHLAMCDKCRRFFDQLRLTVGLVRARSTEDAPAGEGAATDEAAVDDVVRQAIAASRKGPV